MSVRLRGTSKFAVFAGANEPVNSNSNGSDPTPSTPPSKKSGTPISRPTKTPKPLAMEGAPANNVSENSSAEVRPLTMENQFTEEFGAEETESKAAAGDAVVDPWTVEGIVDYDKLIDQFGSQRLGPELVARIERVSHGSFARFNC